MKWIIAICVFMLSACQPGTGEFFQQFNENNPSTPSSDLLNQIQQDIFNPICTQCHVGSQAPVGLRLDSTTETYNNLVNISAIGNNAFKRVLPNDPDNSYLMLKILGDPVAGQRMPLGMAALSEQNIDLIRNWIIEGALPASSNVGLVALTSIELNKDLVSWTPEASPLLLVDSSDSKPTEILSKNKQQKGPGLTLGFSAPIAAASISYDSIQIYQVIEGLEFLLPRYAYRIQLIDRITIKVNFRNQAIQSRKLHLIVGDKATLPLMDQKGLLVDINNSGIKGGSYDLYFEI